MGMGEPLLNLDAVRDALEVLGETDLAAADHGLDRRHRAGHRRARRAGRTPAEPRRLAPRAGRRAAQRADADQPHLSARRAAAPRSPAFRSSRGAGSPSSTCCSPASTTAGATPTSWRGCCRGLPVKVNLIPFNPDPVLPDVDGAARRRRRRPLPRSPRRRAATPPRCAASAATTSAPPAASCAPSRASRAGPAARRTGRAAASRPLRSRSGPDSARRACRRGDSSRATPTGSGCSGAGGVTSPPRRARAGRGRPPRGRGGGARRRPGASRPGRARRDHRAATSVATS